MKRMEDTATVVVIRGWTIYGETQERGGEGGTGGSLQQRREGRKGKRRKEGEEGTGDAQKGRHSYKKVKGGSLQERRGRERKVEG